MAKKAPAAEEQLEARAKSLSPRGIPYALPELLLPEGEWVEVTEDHAAAILQMDWPVTVRPKGGPESHA